VLWVSEANCSIFVQPFRHFLARKVHSVDRMVSVRGGPFSRKAYIMFSLALMVQMLLSVLIWTQNRRNSRRLHQHGAIMVLAQFLTRSNDSDSQQTIFSRRVIENVPQVK
jgi:hypothetical protein